MQPKLIYNFVSWLVYKKVVFFFNLNQKTIYIKIIFAPGPKSKWNKKVLKKHGLGIYQWVLRFCKNCLESSQPWPPTWQPDNNNNAHNICSIVKCSVQKYTGHFHCHVRNIFQVSKYFRRAIKLITWDYSYSCLHCLALILVELQN